jgi:glycosyltransferase involved in cell wall biosynthesis
MNKTISIINYDRGWILDRIAGELKLGLSSQYHVNISSHSDSRNADIYIHMFYLDALPVKGGVNVYYVTHMDSRLKILKLIYLSRFQGSIFICMSKQAAAMLRYIMPHVVVDCLPQKSFNFPGTGPRSKRPLIVGLFFRIYSDGRKNNKAINELFQIASKYSSGDIQFIINGAGFDFVLQDRHKSYIKVHDEEFCRERYVELIKSCDYVLAFGKDEGYVSVLDAAAAGVKVIAIGQGYHLDICLPEGSMLVDDAQKINIAIESLIKARRAIDSSYRDVLDVISSSLNENQMCRRQVCLFVSLTRMLLAENPFKSNIGMKNRIAILIKSIYQIQKQLIHAGW